MAFRQGEENEALLICRKCKGAYPIDALFCGLCGATRSVALGVERDPTPSSSSWSTPVVEEKPVKPAATKNTAATKSFEPDLKSDTTSKKNSKKSDSSSSAPTGIETSELDEIPGAKKSKKKILVIVGLVAVIGISATVFVMNSSKNVQTASGMTTDGPCAIDDATVSHLVDMKNAIDNIPSGSNEGSNKDIILEWARAAAQTADSLKLDQETAIGSVKTLLYNSSKDLGELADLANQWANKNYSNPDTFVADYKAASDKVTADYKLNSDACQDRIPSA